MCEGRVSHNTDVPWNCPDHMTRNPKAIQFASSEMRRNTQAPQLHLQSVLGWAGAASRLPLLGCTIHVTALEQPETACCPFMSHSQNFWEGDYITAMGSLLKGKRLAGFIPGVSIPSSEHVADLWPGNGGALVIPEVPSRVVEGAM